MILLPNLNIHPVGMLKRKFRDGENVAGQIETGW